MRVLVTGSSGHLGEALVRRLRELKHEVVSLDVLPSPFTTHIGSIADPDFVQNCMKDVQLVFHPATLHKPHVATHTRQQFVDTNITGTLNLLEESVRVGVDSFIFTSTTSVFGNALVPPPGQPAAWVTEETVPIPKNIYGVTKDAAEDLCQLFHRKQKLPCLVLRTSRFFPEEDDDRKMRESYADENAKANEFLHRRVDIEDVVSAHLLAAERAKEIGFRKYIISATTPFQKEDLAELRINAPSVVKRHVSDYETEYLRRGWKMFPTIDRVYVNDLARTDLGWEPKHDFQDVVQRLKDGNGVKSSLALLIGSKRYHSQVFAEGPYPVA